MAAPTDHPAKWLTAQQAAEHCQVNIETIYRACQTGGLRHTRIMGRWKLRFLESWLDEWLAKYAEMHQLEPAPTEPPSWLRPVAGRRS